jgi:hypothetical protein
MADLGELVVAWLNGEIEQTPGHGGPPDPETIPLIPALTLANRAGFVTDNSQLAESIDGRTWCAWVSGFTTDEGLERLRKALAGTGLEMAACRGRVHECSKRLFWPCPGDESVSFWLDRCGRVAGLADVWTVMLGDPEPGRNDRLWPALERFALAAEVTP